MGLIKATIGAVGSTLHRINGKKQLDVMKWVMIF